MEIKDFGLIDYAQALELQRQFVSQQKEIIFVCEHPSVITVGRGTGAQADVLTQALPVVDVERGGRATLHIPGQIVVYPILNLKKRGINQVKFLRLLEEVVIETLTDFRIDSHTIEKETGVWVDDERKIASLGIAVKNDMSMHGLALNVCCDLSLYKNLKPCGFSPEVMTSMKQELHDGYWETWKLTDETLTQRVRLRLPENLMEALENLDKKRLDPVVAEEADY